MPYPLRRLVAGRGPRGKYYPPGTDPIVLGESANTVTTYGYDPVTCMQETKVTLCQIRSGLGRTHMARMKFLCDS